MRIVLSASYQYLANDIRAIPSVFKSTGEVLYDARNQIRVVRLENGLILNIKRFRKPSLFNQIVYTFFRASKAERAYINALQFEQLAIPTPKPVAFIERRNPLLQESYLVTLQAPFSRDFYEFRYHAVEGFEDIIRAFARLMADMHQKGVYHLDLSPGNILFEKRKDGEIVFSIVDINRVRFEKTIGKKEACRNFCRLWGKMDFMESLGREYAAVRGWNEEETIALIVHYWKRFWHIKSQMDIDRIFDPSLKREFNSVPRTN